MVTHIILCAVIVIQAISHHIERGKLLDRIMSRNLNEYKARDEPPVHHESAHDRVMKKWRDRE